MIEDANIHQMQGITQTIGNDAICFTAAGAAGGVVVREDYCRSVQFDRSLDDHAWIDCRLVNRAVGEGLEGDDAMLAVQKYRSKHFICLAAELESEKVEQGLGSIDTGAALENTTLKQGDGLMNKEILLDREG
ncbi:hypothetical protein GW15_0210130 [Xanthomonas axonopodis pv. vasculorum]|uniref:Uncharacterized protein n=1 Tax=Xanthomonas axonopodis pv. vasculorum TaxID=325777 RepID=A0A098Q099_9XANT|nr:hypothetical protein GW15_0210130 [Xanthomonas axonopodis pv. vasculorum]